jgi:hypothetical protein
MPWGISDLRKNTWQVPAHLGHATPDKVKDLLRKTTWSWSHLKAVVTKPELGRRLVERARCTGVPSAWVAADTVYGQDRRLRAALERHGKGYVMAVPADSSTRLGPLIDYTAEEIRRLLHQTIWHVAIPRSVAFAQPLWRRAHQPVKYVLGAQCEFFSRIGG